MRHVKNIIAVAVVMGLVPAVWATTFPPLTSSIWEGGWELNGLSTHPPEWTPESGTNPTFTATSIILEADRSFTAGYDLGPSPTRTPDDATSWGIEYRVRASTNEVDPQTGLNQLIQGNWYNPGAQYAPNSGNPGPGFFGTIWFGDQEPSMPLPAGHDFTAYHTYTMLGKIDGGVEVKWYVDGVELALVNPAVQGGNGSVGGSTATQIRPVGAPGTSMEIDYIRWTRGDDLTPGPPPRTFTWNVAGPGDWNSQSNWSPLGKGPPNGNHDAIFGNKITANRTVFTDTAVTVRRIEFDNQDNSYFIAGAGNVNLVTGTDSMGDVAPTIDVRQGTHRFQAHVNLHANTTVDIDSDGMLIFDGALDLMGQALTKTGAGEMAIRNDFLTGGGTLNCLQGTCSGSGTISGDLNNTGGVISPGNSDGSNSVVPEPASIALLLLGLIAAFGFFRRH